VRNIW